MRGAVRTSVGSADERVAEHMPTFTGTVKLKILEAVELEPPDMATRHVAGSEPRLTLIDPYVSMNVDDVTIGRSRTKQRTLKPVWNECFTAELNGARNLQLTVFHAGITSDDFVASCTVSFDELANATKEQGSTESDIWVSTPREFPFGHAGPAFGVRMPGELRVS